MAAKKQSSKTGSKKTQMNHIKMTPMQWGMMAICCCLTAAGGYMAGSRAWTQRQAMQAANAMQGMTGVQVQVVGGAVMVTGQVDTMENYNKVRMMVRNLNGNRTPAMNLAQVSDEGKAAFVAQLRRDIRNRRVHARFLGNRLVLEGMVRNEFEADKAVELAKAALGLGAFGSTRETASDDKAGTTAEGFVILDMIRIKGA